MNKLSSWLSSSKFNEMRPFYSLIIFFIVTLTLMMLHLGQAYFFLKNMFPMLYIMYSIAYVISLLNLGIYFLVNKQFDCYVGFSFVIFNALKISLFIAFVLYLSERATLPKNTIAGHFTIIYFVFALGELSALYKILINKK